MKLRCTLSNSTLLVLLLIIIVNPYTLQAQQFAGGAGTQGDPYLVATADQLNNIRLFPTAYYRQTADIDLGSAPYSSGDGWEPIAAFTGSYDGGGFTISNLVINRAAASNVGLFEEVNAGALTNIHLSKATVTGNWNVGVLAGTVSGNSVITGLSLDNIKVIGSNHVGGMIGSLTSGSVIRNSYSSGGEVQSPDGGITGGLVGWVNRATITTSYSSGIDISVANTPGYQVGGLVGVTEHANISNSYAINAVSGAKYVGGLVGSSQGGSVSTSYSASVATGSASVGGLTGMDFGATFTDSYFNSDSTADNGNGNGTPLTTAQMRQQASFTGFNFDTSWVMLNEGGAFPELRNFVDTKTLFAGGSGTQGDPYLVATAEQLNNVRQSPAAHYRQTADIDLGSAPYSSGDGWEPIAAFIGSYDGGGFTISNLVINRAAASNVGLFGVTHSAILVNIRLDTPRITAAQYYTGALVGQSFNGSSISDVWVTGAEIDVGDNQYAGGLVGVLHSGSSITRSYTKNGSVRGQTMIGGLVGGARNASISGSYSSGMNIDATYNSGGLAGDISGSSSISDSYSINRVSSYTAGGLVGISRGGSISSSYTAGVVTGNSIGGLIGINPGASVSNSYFNSDFTADNGNGNGTPLTTAQMQQRSSFTGFDFQFNWFIDEGVGFPQLRNFADTKTLFAGGSGTQGDPYLVTAAAHLINIRLFPEAHYRQSADIGLNEYQDGEGWAPIRNLTGSYDGGGYFIWGLMINRPATDNIGLFAKVTGATLTNLTLLNPSVTGKSFVGTLVGTISSAASRVSKIQVRGGSVNGADHLGGLAGSNEGAISESAVTEMNISGSGGSIGGLVGAITGSGSISDSYAINKLTGSGNSAPGALAGSLSGTITNSYAMGSGVQVLQESYELVNSNAGIITNSYYICNSNNHGGKNENKDCITQGNVNGTPLDMYGMRREVSFPGFDFVNTWYMNPAHSGDPPRLRALSFTPPTFAGGSGTPEDPYLVSRVLHLAFVGLNPSAHYRQIEDLDMRVGPYSGQSGWRPIANFTGSYDGNGYTLSGLWAHWDDFDDIGLFSRVVGGSLRNITLVNPWVRGKNKVGALVGEVSSETSALNRIRITGGLVVGVENVGGMAGVSEGVISESAATGMRVNGAGYVIGGLIGYARGTGSSITNSYAINKMSSSATGSFPGGLAGFTSATTITNSYTASSGGEGLVSSSGGTITNSYFNSDSSAGSPNGTPLTTAEMSQGSSFTGFDFDATWVLMNLDEAFPELQAFVDFNSFFAGGSGTRANPLQIATANQLNNVRVFPSLHFRQTADINLGVRPYNSSAGWNPIPDFTGSYDGNGFAISNLYIFRGGTHNVGLFAQVTGATLTDIILVKPWVIGRNYTGALAGAFNTPETTVTGVQVIGGSVRGVNQVGGLVGSNEGAIRLSAASGIALNGFDVTGGLVGITTGFGSSITNSYAANKMDVNHLAGGLAGKVNGTTITKSYSASIGIKTTTVGGLVGSRISGSVSNSYYNKEYTPTSAGGTGLSTAQMRQSSSFPSFDFANTWAIDEGVGFPGFQERKENQLILTGSEGWRMLASPLHTHSIGRLFNDLWLQGFPGADGEDGSPNLYFWDEASRSWTVPSDTTFVPGKGTGFLIFLYSDEDNDGIPEGFPKKLNHSGSGFSGDYGIDLSYSNTGSAANDGWNLVGNPYPSSIHWNAVQGWTRSNMDATVYIWDASANNGNGAYVSWNTLGIGTKGDGKIAPWQGFWVKTHTANPRIVFSNKVKSSGGRLLKPASPQIPQLHLELEGKGLSSRAIVLFREQAERGKDLLDAYKLQSLSPDYLLLGTTIDGLEAMDIQALPYSEEPMELELVIEGSDLNGDFSLNWAQTDIPEGWEISLVDTQTGETHEVDAEGSVSFSMSVNAKMSKQRDIGTIPKAPIQVLQAKTASSERFVLRIQGGTAVSNEQDMSLPTEVALQQNYPNPFNPGTTINYQINVQTRVRLEVFDLLGRKVATLVNNEPQQAGYYSVRFDATALSSGIYLYRLETGSKVLLKKMTVIK